MAGNILTVSEWIEAGKPDELYVGIDGIPTLVTVTETGDFIRIEYDDIWDSIEEVNVLIDDVYAEKITGSINFSIDTLTIETLSITILFNDEELKLTKTHLLKFLAYIKERYFNLINVDMSKFPVSVNFIDTDTVVEITKIFLRKAEYASFKEFLDKMDYDNFEKIYDITLTASNIKVGDKSNLFRRHIEELKITE